QVLAACPFRYKTAVAIMANTSITTIANNACSQCSVCLPGDGLLLTRMAHFLFFSDHTNFYITL
ncbi:MAG: hypothetical protein LJE75_12255, partial [Gammaproteobacteria bacterium]|nr:hypothetical protein [Gammaproteobacteria bacterium]